MVNTITERQTNFLNTLQAEREVTPAATGALEALRDAYRMGMATSKMASDVITILQQAPKKGANITAGIYRVADGTLFRAYLGQNSGQMLCKEIVFEDGDLSYRYAGLAERHLTGAYRLTREEVAERTLAYGSTTCMVCGRRLDDPESVDRGIGPVCWENYS